MPSQFAISGGGRHTEARLGRLATAHGEIRTPAFMPVGTCGAVKTMAPAELSGIGTQVILGNTYHLMLRPGMDIIRKAGGLHSFIGWTGPILTDSGGYQVFSLSKLRKTTPDGVFFQSHLDGNSIFLGPKEAMAVQRDLGSDIAMVFDDCPPYPSSREDLENSLALTLRWAAICAEQPRAPNQQIFGIIQGGTDCALRRHAANEMKQLPFDGYAIGGLSVGEPQDDMMQVLEAVLPVVPENCPRYLMGVGTPPQLVEAVARGVDMFDCVLPTRLARNGTAYTSQGAIPVKAGRYKEDFGPIDETCGCYACRNFSRAYIRHLLNIDEILGLHLMTIHNLYFYLNLMAGIRSSLQNDDFTAFRYAFHKKYAQSGREGDN